DDEAPEGAARACRIERYEACHGREEYQKPERTPSGSRLGRRLRLRMGASFMRPVAALLVAVSVVATAVASYFAFLPGRLGTVRFWVLAGGPAVVLAGFAAAWAWREDLLREWLAPRWGDFSRGV